VITETFGATTGALLTSRDWLQAYGVTHVAMESTGVYWKSVYYMLEDACTLLVNVQHVKQVPGHKSDVRDSAWIAQLLEWRLLRESGAARPDPRPARPDTLIGNIRSRTGRAR
jgi:transposase